VAVLAAALFHLAQRPARGQDAAQQPTFRVSVDRIQIGAVVTDSKGRHVTDLSIADFTVLDGDKRQQLTHCEYVRLANPGVAPRAVPARRGPRAPPPVASHELTPEQVQRAIVFLLDDVSFAATTIPAVREAVRSTIERSLQPGDLAALIRTSSGNGSLEQFTSDKRVLLESAEKIRWRPESRGNPGLLPQTSGTVVGEEKGMSTYLVADSQNRTKVVLQYVISALRDLPGRKAIFLISQSFPYGMNNANPASLTATDIGKLVDQALRAGVVVYSVDPTPLSILTPDASYDVTREYTAKNGVRNGAGSITNREAVSLLTGYTHRSLVLLEMFRSGLRALAEGTGGQMAADTDAGTALGRFADDLQGYYLLTYKPLAPERYFALKEGDPPPFRNIKLRVARAGMHVRSYAGYIAAPDRAESETSAHGELSKALFSPFSAASVHVDMTSIFTVPRPASPELSLLLHINLRDLSFTSGEDGRHNAGVELVARAAGEQNEPAQVVSKDAVLRLEESSFEDAMRMGMTYRVSVPAQRAGLYEVRVAVRDTASGELGSAREFVEVPDLRNGRLAASGVLVYNASPRAGDADAPGLSELRRFRREDSLSYSCQIFNAKSIVGEVRIARDGKQVSAAAAEVVGNGDGTSTARGVIPLATLAPGYYVLQVVASGGLAKDVAASQWTDFEIVPEQAARTFSVPVPSPSRSDRPLPSSGSAQSRWASGSPATRSPSRSPARSARAYRSTT
jgi:VWFA-related protein